MTKPEELPPDVRQALGDIVIAWATVEAVLAEFLSFLLRADPGSMYVLNQDVAVSTQLKWIRALARDRFRDEKDQGFLNDLFVRVETLRGERNAYVHALWGTGPEPHTARAQTVKLDRSEVVREQLVTSPDLHELTGDIQELATDLFNLAKGLGIVR